MCLLSSLTPRSIQYQHSHYYTDLHRFYISLGSSCPSGKKRVRVTVPEQELLIRCYEEKGGQSWEEVLEQVRDSLDSLPFNRPTVEFYMEQDDRPAIKFIRRTISAEMKTATAEMKTATAVESKSPVS